MNKYLLNKESRNVKNHVIHELQSWNLTHKSKLTFFGKLYHYFVPLVLPAKRLDYWLCWRRGLLAKSILYYNPCEKDYEIIADYFDEYIKKKGCVIELENIYNGEAILLLYNFYKKKSYEKIIISYIDFLLKVPKDIEGSIPYFNNKTDILVDGLMCTPFIFMSLKYYQRNRELEIIGYKQIMNFIKRGFDDKTGLPYHAYNSDDCMQKGIYGWGRGVGWFLSSVVISLEYMEKNNDYYSAILQKFIETVKDSIGYQLETGLFTWCLLTPHGPIDTSTTCMILYSVAKGINLGILPAAFIANVQKGRDSLCFYIRDGRLYQAMADCGGLSVYPQEKYGNYPWSDGFLLLLDSEIDKF